MWEQEEICERRLGNKKVINAVTQKMQRRIGRAGLKPGAYRGGTERGNG